MSKSLFVYVKKHHLFTRLVLVTTSFILAGFWLLPAMSGTAEAAGQITNRSLTISTAVAGQTGVTYTFSFRTATTSQPIYAFKFIACTTAVGSYPGGTCTAPTGIHFDVGSYNSGAEAGFTDTTNHFALDGTGANDCTPAANVLCIKRATTTGNDTNNATNKTLQFTGITNPTTTNTAFYVGIDDYNNATYSTASNGLVDAGTTATAIVQSLTINARVAEILNFCIGNTTVDDATTNPTPSGSQDCTQISGTSVNIGTLDSGAVNVSPVSVNGGDGNNGIAMVRSNAANGVNVYYRAIQATSGTNHLGALRLNGAVCSGTNTNTDGCINSIGNTQTKITAGTEDFGMTVAGVNCGSTTSYSCTYATGAYDLVPQSPYVGEGSNTFCSLATCNTAGNGFAWDETGTTEELASSSGSTIKQVDDEALILKFAATDTITTPFGPYSVQADFIAVPTY